MKTIMVTVVAALLSWSAMANNPGKDPDSYCAKSGKDGKLIVMHNGSKLTKDVELTDGTRLKPNGTIVFASGKRVELNRGECVNKNNIGHFEYRKGKVEKKIDKVEDKIEKKTDRAEDKIENKKDRLKEKKEANDDDLNDWDK